MHKKKAKVLVIGDAGSGKSTLVESYAKRNFQFSSDYNLTQGVEVHSKIIPFPGKNVDVELFLFDLSGHEFYEDIALGMAKNPDLIMLVYDCTNSSSLSNGFKWLDKVKKMNNRNSFPGVLVGAKSEHKSAKQISTEQSKKYGSKIGFESFEVSAAYNQDVEQPFQYLANKVIEMESTSFS